MNPKVNRILITKGDPNDYTKIGPRLYRMNGDGEIKVYTDLSVFTFIWCKSFVTDGLSGGEFIDLFREEFVVLGLKTTIQMKKR